MPGDWHPSYYHKDKSNDFVCSVSAYQVCRGICKSENISMRFALWHNDAVYYCKIETRRQLAVIRFFQYVFCYMKHTS